MPGDIIQIPTQGCALQCDAILISGGATINESTLTGESTPIHKTAISKFDYTDSVNNEIFCAEQQSKHMLYCGTHVICCASNTQARNFSKKIAAKPKKVLKIFPNLASNLGDCPSYGFLNAERTVNSGNNVSKTRGL